MAVFEIHHIIIETFIGCIGVIIRIFVFQMTPQISAVDEVLNLRFYGLVVSIDVL